MRNCFIPKCDMICRSNPRRMMFLAPKDEKMFNLWKEVLPKKREFKPNDKICERHFVKEAIQTTFDHVINGALLQMERGRPRLKADAIPTLNLEVDEDMFPKKTQQRTLKKAPKKEQPETSISDNALEEVVMRPSSNKIRIQQIETITPANIQVSEPLKATDEDGVSNPMETVMLPQFELLYDEIFEVTLPSMLWGVHRESERQYIAFTCFDITHMQATKSVALSSNGCLKIALNGRIISEQFFSDELTAEFMSNVLNEVDDTRFCLHWAEKKECNLIASKGSEFCTTCA